MLQKRKWGNASPWESVANQPLRWGEQLREKSVFARARAGEEATFSETFLPRALSPYISHYDIENGARVL